MSNDEMVTISKNNLGKYHSLIDEATAEYYSWIKQILAVSVGSLTILVALRNQILPDAPQAIFLLQLSWILFAASIVLALYTLRGHHDLLFHTARDFAQAAINEKSEKAGETVVQKKYLITGKITPWALVSAIVLLTLFGIVNLSQDAKTTDEIQKTQASALVPPNNQ